MTVTSVKKSYWFSPADNKLETVISSLHAEGWTILDLVGSTVVDSDQPQRCWWVTVEKPDA